MKLVFLFGNAAVGKMTVGQELMKITDLRLFHNHMTIEPVLDVFGTFDVTVINRLREVFFQEFARSEQYGMIFTFMWAFDSQEDWQYVNWIRSIFEPYDTEFYYVELVADKQTRLERNVTPNRLARKASKRDLEASERRMLAHDDQHRWESLPGELPFENYIKIENTNLPAETVAWRIKEHFLL